MFKQIEKDSIQKAILIFLYVAICILYSFVSVIKHNRYETAGDIGVFNQVFWQLSHFQWPWISFNLSRPFLSDHFSPILFILLPFYFVYPDARMLLIVQPFIALAGVFPLYKIANLQTKSKLFSWAIVLTYFFYPPLHNAILFEFHDIVFTPTLFAFAYYFFLLKRKKEMNLTLFLMLFVREEIGFFVATFGLYLLIFQKKFRWLGLLWLVAGISFSLTIMHVVIPKIGGNYYYFDYGGSGYYPKDVFLDTLRNPRSHFYLLFDSPVKRATIFDSYQPFLFLPLFSPVSTLISLEQFASRFFDYRTLARWTSVYHYSSPLAPVMAIGCIWTVHKLIKIKPQWQKIILSTTSVLLFLSTLWNTSKLDLVTYIKTEKWQRESWMDCYDKAINTIPQQGSTATDIQFMPHLSYRTNIHYLSESYETEFILLPLNKTQNKQPYGIYFFRVDNPEKLKQDLVDKTKNGEYSIIFNDCSLLGLKKNAK